jgi:solute carrier family 25 carnitine/acylcarnitine transporter 20/29
MKKIYSAHGIAGIYKGQGVTLLREATGYGVYFLAYEKLVQREMATKGIKREEISPAHAVLYGAAAGYAVCSRIFCAQCSFSIIFSQLWAVIYPIDMIKSRIQTDGFSPSTGQKYKSARDCFRITLKTEGIAAFMRGLGPTLIRCIHFHDIHLAWITDYFIL